MLKRILFSGLLLFAVIVSIGHAAQPRHLVLMIGEDEYKTWETLPKFAASELKAAGYRITIIHADKADKNQFPGLIEALRDSRPAVGQRPPAHAEKEQLDAVRAHLARRQADRRHPHGEPWVLAPAEGNDADPGAASGTNSIPKCSAATTPDITARSKVTVRPRPVRQTHPIFNGVAVSRLIGSGGLYKNRPLKKTATPLLIGTIPGQAPEPVAWTHRYGPKQARFSTRRSVTGMISRTPNSGDSSPTAFAGRWRNSDDGLLRFYSPTNPRLFHCSPTRQTHVRRISLELFRGSGPIGMRRDHGQYLAFFPFNADRDFYPTKKCKSAHPHASPKLAQVAPDGFGVPFFLCWFARCASRERLLRLDEGRERAARLDHRRDRWLHVGRGARENRGFPGAVVAHGAVRELLFPPSTRASSPAVAGSRNPRSTP